MNTTQWCHAVKSALVLDDSLVTGKLVCNLFRALNIPARCFKSPIPFLAELRSSEASLLVLDVTLERFDAIDVIRQLEALNFKGKVLLMSGCEEVVLQEIARIGHSRGLAMLPPLRKPFGAEALNAHVLAPPLVSPGNASERGIRGSGDGGVSGVSLKHALEKGWLEVWYQSKVDLRTFTVCGAEALIRARHPEHGILAPAQFLPPAGDPLYQPLTRFVLRSVTTDWVTFARRDPCLKLALNVPASVLNASGFVEFVRNALPRDAKFPGLIMEITEDEIVSDLQWAGEVATQLTLYGISLSIDDFGAGYASLSRLTEFRFAEIKLDAHFVSGCGTDALKQALCKTVVDLAQRFGASVCAEGVETEADLRCLANLGFDTAQGFLLGRPMPAVDFATSMKVRDSYSDLFDPSAPTAVSAAS